jgi:hypothetical protein
MLLLAQSGHGIGPQIVQRLCVGNRLRKPVSTTPRAKG